jgi:hypothetical protein
MFSPVAPSTTGGASLGPYPISVKDQPRHISKSFILRTSKKRVRKPRRMITYDFTKLKASWNEYLQKKYGVGGAEEREFGASATTALPLRGQI